MHACCSVLRPAVIEVLCVTSECGMTCHYWCVEAEQEEDADCIGDAPVLRAISAAEASVCIRRVLGAVHTSLSSLMREDNLQLRFLHVARHHLVGRDEAAELQVPSLLSPHFSCYTPT